MVPVIILLAPLLGAVICGFLWKQIGERTGQYVSTGLLFLAAVLSWYVFLTFDGATQHIEILRWIESGSLSADWAIRLDRLTAIMLVVVTTVSALVHLYSLGYMAHDENWAEDESYRARFFAYLSFFTFAMLALVTSDNLVQMFFGWEGVGVASYLLIGFYYRKASANAAAIKAFVVNRIGDFGFALGIFGLFYMTDSIKFDDVFAAAPTLGTTDLHFLWRDWNAANVLGVLLFIGAMGKSAQLFLHLAARRDGGADAGFCADPRCNNGNSGGVPRLPNVAGLRICASGQRADRDHRRFHCVLCRDRCAGAERHQARHRLFDLLTTWLHVRRCRLGRL